MRIRKRTRQLLAVLLTMVLTVTVGFPAEAFAEGTEGDTVTVSVSVYDYTAADAGLAEASSTGVILEDVAVEIPAHTAPAAAVTGALKKAAEQEQISCTVTESDYGPYLTEVNGLSASVGEYPMSGWTYCIDRDYDAWQLTEVAEGAQIAFHYTLDGGADINNGYDSATYQPAPPACTSFTLAGETVNLSKLILTGEGTKESPYLIPVKVPVGTDLSAQLASYETTLNSHYAAFESGEGLADLSQETDFSAGVICCLTGTFGTGRTYYKIAPYNMTITVPAKSKLFVGTKSRHYVPFAEVEETGAKETEDGSVVHTYLLQEKQVYNYRVSGKGFVTYGNKFTMSQESKPLIITAEQLAGNPKQTDHAVTSNSGYNVADVYLNINDQNYLKMNTGETFQIVNLRSWEAVDSITSNYFIEPDYHYTVIDEYGNPSEAVSVDEDGRITAKRKGTAIVLVTYDAMTVFDSFYGALWPENTGVIVVSVDAEESGIELGMTLHEGNPAEHKLSGSKADGELDVFYYLKGEEGAYYSFTPAAGSEVALLRPTVTADAMTYQGGFGTTGVTKQGAACTVCLKEGRNIVKVTKDGKSEYQVLTAKQVSYRVENETRPGEAACPGDTLKVIFDTVYHPVNKLAGVYNMSAKLVYEAPEGIGIKASASQYTFASKAQTLTLTVPEDYEGAEIRLTGGKITVSGFGDPFGNHRGITYTTGKDPNFNAQMRTADFAVLPDIIISVAHEITQAEKAAAAVDTLIERIGAVTLDSRAAIDAARAAYNRLSEEAKTYVTRLDLLTAAEKSYEKLTEISEVMVEKLVVSPAEATLLVGQKMTLQAAVSPEHATNQAVRWTSSRPSVAAVSGDGVVTANKAGSAVITAAATDSSGKKAVCRITVKKPTVKFNVTTVRLQVKKSFSRLKAKGLQKGDAVRSYSSSNPKVASVSRNGKLRANRTGSATITVKTTYGAKASCKVKVQRGVVKTKALRTDKSRWTLKKGKQIKLSVTRNPISATDKLTFTSSNQRIASVNAKGVVRGIRRGTCRITIKAEGGAKKTVKITVK